MEFQKRGLPHAHILLFLGKANKYPEPADIDKIISSEIPDPEADPDYYKVVSEFMVHGPCGIVRPNSPCMSERRCTKYFPKNYRDATIVDEYGYAVYRRRNNDIPLDNRYIVSHNRYLLMKYGAHINVEWCNQSQSIKYLFKYVNKGNDRVTAAFYNSTSDADSVKEVDEVKMYYDCRYISPCEAAWRLFGFEIQYRDPAVERLGFHLPNEQHIIYDESMNLDDVMSRETVTESMFLAWFEANKKYPDARLLTYPEFPTKFVWKKKKREWTPRKQGFAIGRLRFVPPGSGDLYYMRLLLNIICGATCYEDLRFVNGAQHNSFRDACYALGLLDDDKEYINGIIEVSNWASAAALRVLFVTLLSSDSISRPEVVWNSCWSLLSDDILYRQRMLFKHPGNICYDLLILYLIYLIYCWSIIYLICFIHHVIVHFT